MNGRLLVVGQTYLNPVALKKYIKFSQDYPNIELKVLVPSNYLHQFHSTFDDPGFLDRVGSINRSNMTYLLNPLNIWKILKEFNPTNVHLEEDPHSLVSFEIVLMIRLFFPNVKLSYFIWDNLNNKPKFPLNLLKNYLTRFGLSRAIGVVCGNRRALEILRKEKNFHGYSILIPQLGLDPEDYREKRIHGGDPVVIGFVGRLIEPKGLSVLMDALMHINDREWVCKIIGSGPMWSTLKSYEKFFGGKLKLLGPLPPGSVPEAMRSIDIFVLPSLSTNHWVEQFGYALAQAMATGNACIGSNSGAIPEVLGPNGVTGLIFDEGDARALANQILRLIDDKDLRGSLGGSSRELALMSYANSVIAEKHMEFFKEINSGLQ